MITRKYAVVCDAAVALGPKPALDIIIEAETLDEVKDMAPDAVDSALAFLAAPTFEGCESRMVEE